MVFAHFRKRKVVAACIHAHLIHRLFDRDRVDLDKQGMDQIEILLLQRQRTFRIPCTRLPTMLTWPTG